MATLAERSQALTASFDIRAFLDAIERDAPTEVVHVTDQRFSTLRARRFRALGGYSEGAFAAINIALHHPKTFSIAESWSGYGREHHKGPFAQATPLQIFENSPSLYAPTLTNQLQRWPLSVMTVTVFRL